MQVKTGSRLSLLSDYLPPGPVVLDTSSLINLLGTDQCPRILAALEFPVFVESRTLRELRRHPIPDRDHVAAVLALFDSKLLREDQLTDEEYETYLSLVQGEMGSRLDDGESAAVALSFRTNHSVVLDENKARKVVSARYPQASFCSTTKLFLTAAARAGWVIAEVQGYMLSAKYNARMGIPRDEREFVRRLMGGVTGWE
jgi:predicted nucleic acid-binding protein